MAVEMLDPKDSVVSACAALPMTPLFVDSVRARGHRAWLTGAYRRSAAYLTLKDLGFVHRARSCRVRRPGSCLDGGVHRVAALVQRWILGTHHGSVQPEHLDAYLDEFVFRFNRRTSNSRGMLFYRLLQQAVVTAPVTYRDVVKKA
jgi:hypothetical protein